MSYYDFQYGDFPGPGRVAQIAMVDMARLDDRSFAFQLGTALTITGLNVKRRTTDHELLVARVTRVTTRILGARRQFIEKISATMPEPTNDELDVSVGATLADGTTMTLTVAADRLRLPKKALVSPLNGFANAALVEAVGFYNTLLVAP